VDFVSEALSLRLGGLSDLRMTFGEALLFQRGLRFGGLSRLRLGGTLRLEALPLPTTRCVASVLEARKNWSLAFIVLVMAGTVSNSTMRVDT